jgi:hypothetical protein
VELNISGLVGGIDCMLIFYAANTLLSPSNCLNTCRTDRWLEGELIGGRRWRYLSITKATGSGSYAQILVLIGMERIE